MAYFTPFQLSNDVSGDDAWRAITGAIRSGCPSVEVVTRIVDGRRVWEFRAWDDIRGDGEASNAEHASPDTDY